MLQCQRNGPYTVSSIQGRPVSNLIKSDIRIIFFKKATGHMVGTEASYVHSLKSKHLRECYDAGCFFANTLSNKFNSFEFEDYYSIEELMIINNILR